MSYYIPLVKRGVWPEGETAALKLDAERYRKVEAWMLTDARLFEISDTIGRAGVVLYGPTFDAAVDALPEPERGVEGK